MFKKDIGLNLVIIFHFITIPFLIWLVYESKQSGNNTELMAFGISAIVMFIIGYGLFARVNPIRIISLIFTWLNIAMLGLQVLVGIPWVLLSGDAELDLFEASSTIFWLVISILIVKVLHSEKVKIQFTPNKAIKKDVELPPIK